MFSNRISRFQFDITQREPQAATTSFSAGFAMLPSFGAAATAMAGPPDVYRMAYEQAKKQVAARRERQRRAHEWN